MFRALRQEDPFQVIVRAARLTPQEFLSEVASRRNEIKLRAHGKVGVLKLEKSLDDQTTLFRVQKMDDGYVSEIIFLRGGSLVRVSLESFEEQFLAAEDLLIKFASGIKEKTSENHIAGLSGFCMGGVIVTGDLQQESARFHFRDRIGNVFGLVIETYSEDSDVPLLSRVSGPDSLLSKFDVHHRVLRSGERTVAGMRAQEWLSWAQVGEDRDEFQFALETMRATPSKTAPKIHLSLDTAQTLPDGTETKNTMSDEQATQLWDSTVNSIRSASE
jgi:hypothetical protein